MVIPPTFGVLNSQHQEIITEPKSRLQLIPKESYPFYQKKNQTVSEYRSFPCGLIAVLSLTLSLLAGIS